MKNPDDIQLTTLNHLDQSIQDLPPQTLDKLAKARQTAIQHAAENTSKNKLVSLPQNSHQQALRKWLSPAWGIAASVVLAVPLWFSLQSSQPQESELSEQQLTGLELITTLAELSDDDIELVDDLEFALWLLEQQTPASPQQEIPAVHG